VVWVVFHTTHKSYFYFLNIFQHLNCPKCPSLSLLRLEWMWRPVPTGEPSVASDAGDLAIPYSPARPTRVPLRAGTVDGRAPPPSPVAAAFFSAVLRKKVSREYAAARFPNSLSLLSDGAMGVPGLLVPISSGHGRRPRATPGTRRRRTWSSQPDL
jgi:hypothetical protein